MQLLTYAIFSFQKYFQIPNTKMNPIKKALAILTLYWFVGELSFTTFAKDETSYVSNGGLAN